MCMGTLAGTLAANEPSALSGDLAVAGLAVELGEAEHVGEALLGGEALEQAHLHDAARLRLCLMLPSDAS